MNLTINQLPSEMIVRVLRHLRLSELLEKKLVCKLWNELISSQLKLTRFVVQFGRRKNRCWNVTHLASQPVDELRCHPHPFVAQLRHPILTGLRYLQIVLHEELSNFNLNDLNAFVRLVHLEVSYPIRSPRNEADWNYRVNWNLPSLEILKFSFWRAGNEWNNFRMWIDCPKLKAIFFNEGRNYSLDESIHVKWPETIIVLCGSLDGSKLAEFKNVEIYKCEAELRFVNDRMIRQLPKLKKLELNCELECFRRELESVDGVRQFLKRLLNDRTNLQRFDLRLFFAGVEIRDEASVDRLDLRMVEHGMNDWVSLSNEHFYFGDYRKDDKPNLQEELEFVRFANYNRLMCLTDAIPRDYFKRFWRIQHLVTDGKIQDPDHFASYIKRLEYLVDLSLHYPALEQAWYDRLPTICSLRNFKLCEEDEIELHFDFLGLFESGIRWQLDRTLSLRSVKSLASLFKTFQTWYERKFRFKFRGAEAMIRMRKLDDDSDQSCGSDPDYLELGDDYDVLINKRLKLEKANLMDVFNYFQGLESES